MLTTTDSCRMHNHLLVPSRWLLSQQCRRLLVGIDLLGSAACPVWVSGVAEHQVSVFTVAVSNQLRLGGKEEE